MSIKIEKLYGYEQYYVSVDGELYDEYVSALLKIDMKKYREGLTRFGGTLGDTDEFDDDDILFLKEEDAKKALEEFVMPLYIAMKLGG